MRDIHRFLRVFIPLAGGLSLVFSELVIPRTFCGTLIVGVGITMIVVGFWRVFYSFLPEERRFTALRDEVNTFTEIVRQLNAIAYAARQEAHVWYPQTIQDLKAAMHDSVERMAEVAGVPEAMQAAEQAGNQIDARADMPEPIPAATT